MKIRKTIECIMCGRPAVKYVEAYYKEGTKQEALCHYCVQKNEEAKNKK